MIGIGIGIPYNKVLSNPIVDAFKARVLADGGTFAAEGCLTQCVVALKGNSLYDKASLILTPNAYKASKMYALKPTDGSGDLTYSRASTAMRRNSAGVWESVSNNLPRLHYPVGSGCPAWLFEAQRTNDIIRSIELDSASWTKSACSVSPNLLASPDGVQNADFIVEDATTNIHGVYQIKNITGTYTYSFFAKAGTRDKVAFLTNAVSSVDKYIYFDLTNLTVNNPASGLMGSITDEGNGWRRISISFSATGGTTYYFMQLISNSLSSAIYAGNGTSGVYMWQGQLEESGPYATSPIITVGSAVTRVADSINTYNPSALNCGNQGTVFFEFAFTKGSSDAASLRFGSTGTELQFALYESTTGLGIRDYLNSRWLIDPANAPIGGKYAMKWNGSTWKCYFNGVLQNSYVSGTAFDITQMATNADSFGILMFKKVLIFKTALTDAECAALTT